MKRRKVIGWLIFSFGIPILFIASAVSKEIAGSLIPGMFIGALVIGGGWILAHPKRNNGKS
jgi:predicted permease